METPEKKYRANRPFLKHLLGKVTVKCVRFHFNLNILYNDSSLKKMWFLYSLVALLMFMQEQVHGGKLVGSFRGSNSWLFLDKFAFFPAYGAAPGNLHVKLDFPSKNLIDPTMLMYFMEDPEQTTKNDVRSEFGYWEAVYAQQLTCPEIAQKATEGGGIFIQLRTAAHSTSSFTGDAGETRTAFEMQFNFTTSKTRWVFISVGNCAVKSSYCNGAYCSNSLDVGYDLTMKNGDSFFSADEAWFKEVSIVFFVFYIILSGLTLYTRRLLKAEKKYHHSVRLLAYSIFASLCSTMFATILYCHYDNTGEHLSSIQGIGIMFSIVAEVLLLLMTILVGKGWTIVRRKISATGRVKIAIYITVYTVAYFTSWVYYAIFTDIATVNYIFATPPGTALVVLRILVFLWFSYCVYTTLRQYRQKKSFYRKFWFLLGLWILSLPILLGINNMVDVWFRAKLMYLLQLLVLFFVQTVLIVMYNPQHCDSLNKNFPFHGVTNDYMKNHHNGPQSQISNSFEEAHILRAFQISAQMRHSVVMLQSYTSDLHSFLEGIRQDKGVSLDVEAGIPLTLANVADSKVQSENVTDLKMQSKKQLELPKTNEDSAKNSRNKVSPRLSSGIEQAEQKEPETKEPEKQHSFKELKEHSLSKETNKEWPAKEFKVKKDVELTNEEIAEMRKKKIRVKRPSFAELGGDDLGSEGVSTSSSRRKKNKEEDTVSEAANNTDDTRKKKRSSRRNVTEKQKEEGGSEEDNKPIRKKSSSRRLVKEQDIDQEDIL